MKQLEVTLASFICDTCNQRVQSGRHRALVITTWRRRGDTVCMDCWRSIMQSALDGIRWRQPDLFDGEE
jgi:hypothetical protein